MHTNEIGHTISLLVGGCSRYCNISSTKEYNSARIAKVDAICPSLLAECHRTSIGNNAFRTDGGKESKNRTDPHACTLGCCGTRPHRKALVRWSSRKTSIFRRFGDTTFNCRHARQLASALGTTLSLPVGVPYQPAQQKEQPSD